MKPQENKKNEQNDNKYDFLFKIKNEVWVFIVSFSGLISLGFIFIFFIDRELFIQLDTIKLIFLSFGFMFPIALICIASIYMSDFHIWGIFKEMNKAIRFWSGTLLMCTTCVGVTIFFWYNIARSLDLGETFFITIGIAFLFLFLSCTDYRKKKKKQKKLDMLDKTKKIVSKIKTSEKK